MLHVPKDVLALVANAEEPLQRLLSDIEHQVVQLSFKDDRRSLPEATSLHRFWQRAFGRGRPNALADPRLEALRIFCVRYRYDRDVVRQLILANGASGQFLEPEMMAAAAAIIDRSDALQRHADVHGASASRGGPQSTAESQHGALTAKQKGIPA